MLVMLLIIYGNRGVRTVASKINCGIPSLGQGFTSTITLAHVWSAYAMLTVLQHYAAGVPPTGCRDVRTYAYAYFTAPQHLRCPPLVLPWPGELK